jgi:hypothetical protein
MPSILHDALIRLLRNRPELAPELLQSALSLTLPRYTDVRVDSADLTEVQPAEYRADLVILLCDVKPVLGLIVEVQLARDRHKRFAWPAYVANLRARWRCPVCLLVICTDVAVARWAETPTHLGCTNVFTPRVLPLDALPEFTKEADAEVNPELTVFSAVMHGEDADILKAARLAAIAQGVSAKLDADRSALYVDLVLSSLSEAARKVLQENMRADGYVYQSDFAKHYVAEGRVEGLAQGRAALVTRLLAVRFGALSEGVKEQIASKSIEELDAIGERLLTAATLQEALTPRS